METAKALQQIPSSYIREILKAATSPDVISLAGGLPDPHSFPIELMKETIAQMPQMPELFQYGATAGYPPLLSFLAERYELSDDHSMVITTGSQQGLDLIARAFINPGDGVVMEAPSYLGAMQVFGLCQANILTVPQNGDGPLLNELELCFRKEQPKIFYAVPDFHNPTGVCWSQRVREKVAELCRRYKVTLIEDAPYRELRFGGETLPMVSTFCPDRAIVLRSFSKIATPGLRIGCVSGPKRFIDPLIKVKQAADLHSSVPVQEMLLGVLRHEAFPAHLNKVKAAYRTRYQHIHQLLCDHLPDHCTFREVDGGMFIWVTLPQCDTLKLANELLSGGVAVVPSIVFYPANAEGHSALRLNFTHATPEQLTKAVCRLGLKLGQIFSAETLNA